MIFILKVHNIPIKFRTKSKKILSPSALQKQYKKYIKRNENMLNIKNDNENLNYVGNFGTFSKEGEMIKYSQNKSDYVELNFTGNKVRFYTHTNTWRGKANIYIDDIKTDTIDTYSQEEMMDVLAYESEDLGYGDHKIKIEVLGEKREAAYKPKIAVYRFEVDEERNNNLDLAELKAIVAELKVLINEQR